MFLDSDCDNDCPEGGNNNHKVSQCKKSALESFMGASRPSSKPASKQKKARQNTKPKLGDLEQPCSEISSNGIMESCFSLIIPKVNRPILPNIATTGSILGGVSSTTIPPQPPQQALSLPIPRKIGEDREICVARFGKIYKRKAPSSIGHLVKPCPPGYRFCKFCNESLPLSAFYTNVKRYVCKRHHYLRVIKTFRLKVMGKSGKQYYQDLWDKLSEYRYQFGYDKLRYDASDIKDLLDKSQVSMLIRPMLIPIDPQLPMRPRNVAIVSSRAFSFAMKLFGFTCSRALFIAFVQKSNLLPPNFDVARPDDPYHDPYYVRKDYDLPKIFEEERLSHTINEHEDRVILEELAKNDDVPWINRIPYPGDKKNVGPVEGGVDADNGTQPAI
jgi:hypothetical protein